MLAMAELGEKDPLLMTFVIMTEIEERDRKYAEPFHDLCKPLQDAWVMKMLRLTVPDVYKKEIEEIYKLRETSLGFWLMCYENPEIKGLDRICNDMALTSSGADALCQFARMDPDVSLYLKLPEAVNAPYEVGIGGTTDRYYVVRKRRRKKNGDNNGISA